MNSDMRIVAWDMGRIMFAAVIALLLGSALILSAVGPARAGEAPVAANKAALAALPYLA